MQLDQIARNDISYLGLQFFIAGLHTDISLEVIKSNTADMYEAFMIAHAYETAVKSRKEKENSFKVNEMAAEFEDEDERAIIEVIKRKYQQKRMFCSYNEWAYQQCFNGGNGSNYSNGSNGNNGQNRNGGNQQSGSGAQCKPNLAFGKTCHYCKKKNHFQSDCYKRKRDDAPLVKVQELDEQDGGKNVKTIFKSKTRNQLLCSTKRELHKQPRKEEPLWIIKHWNYY